MVSPEQARDVAKKYAKWGLLALTIILAPVIYTVAISFVEMMWALAAVAITAGLIYAFAPAFIDWVGSMRFKAVEAQAEANPIETMEGIYVEKTNELNEQANAVTEVDTQYRNVNNLVSGLKKTDPEEAQTYVEIANKIKEGLDELNAELDDATKELQSYKAAMDKAKRIWKVQLGINAALNVVGAARSQVFRDIKQQVAFDTVNTNLNKAFARLDTAVKRRKGMMSTSPAGVVEGQVVEPKALTEGAPVNSSAVSMKAKVNS